MSGQTPGQQPPAATPGPPPVCPDTSFGPHIGLHPWPTANEFACRGGFDFTLLFEESILSIPISIILLIVVPIRILQLIKQPVQVGQSVLRPLKVGFSFCLILIQGALLALWASTSDSTIVHTKASIPAAALAFAASLAVFPLSWLEHERSIRPSFVLSVYFFLAMICDLPRTRTLWQLGDYQTIPILQTFCSAARLVMLALESTEKRSILLTKKFLSYEITSSTISRAGFFWLIPLFRKGFKRNLLLEDLYPLDPELESTKLHSTLSAAWRKAPNKKVPGALVGIWMGAFRLGLWAPVFPRLCIIGFTYAQPFLMEKAIQLAFLPDLEVFNNWGYGLIGAFVFVYGGTAIAAGQYAWRVRRSAARMRGSVISLIYEKSLRLDINSKSVSPTGALTLVGNDVENIIQGMNQLHELWAGVLEIIIAVYLISRRLGAACAMPIAVAFLVILITGSMAIPSGAAQAAWIGASQARITATSKTLGSIKWIKVSGLNDMAFALIRRLRTAELAVSLRFRLLLAGTMVMLIVVPIWSPILTFSTYAGLAKKNGDSAELVTIFTSYSLITLLNGPLSNLIVALPILAGAFTSFLRIQGHLNGKERTDTRVNLMDATNKHLLSHHSNSSGSDTVGGHESYELTERKSTPSAALDKGIIASIQGTFAWKKDADPVLNITDLNLRKGALTFIVGPVGCGKSTLLKALLGELSNFEGSIRVNFSGGLTFSDQLPWVPNETVRSIIVGSSDYDEHWYKTVVRAVALDEDFLNWPAGESTVAGTKGISMSGGQKQRLSIARAVYSRRELLVFDDCLSGLDASTSKIVFESLFGRHGLLRGGDRTVVASSSDVSRLRYADEIIYLDETGSIREQGTPEELAHILDFSLVEEDEPAEPRMKSSWTPAAVVTSAAKELADREILEDKTRRLGDSGMYGFYARAAGRVTLAILIVSMAIYAFCASFPTVWLGRWTASKNPLDNLGKWLGVYVVLGVGAIAAVGCGIYQILVRIINKSGVVFHDQLLETVSKAPLSFHSSVDSGITVNRFSQDLRLIDMELPSAAFGMATTTSFCVAQFILVAVASKYMAAFLPLLMVLLYLIQFFYLRTSRQVRLLDIEHKAPLYSQLIETLAGLPTIRAFQWEDRYEKKNLRLVDESQQPSYQIACLQCWLNMSTDVFIMILALIFITLATTLREEIGGQSIGIGLSNVLGFSGTMKSLVTFWVMLEISLGAVSRVRSFVQETKKEGADDPPTEEPKDPENWPRQGHIELRDIVASYPGTGPIINGVSLSVNPGEKIAICGRTGSGKSSLTLALLRMMDLDSGSIIVDGINTKTLPHEYVRKKFVALPQEAYVFDGTVRLNVDPSQTISDEQIEEVLVAVQLWPKVKARGGLDTVISDDFFSPGEAQLLVFARAMLRNSRVLILDEFTSALDEQTGAIVDRLLNERFSGWTIIQIAHKLELVLDYDKVAVLDAGRLMELDNPRQLLERDSIFRSLYEASLQRKKEEEQQQQQETKLTEQAEPGFDINNVI